MISSEQAACQCFSRAGTPNDVSTVGSEYAENPMIRRVKTIDAHVAGEPLRLIVEGCPSPAGATMLEKRSSMRKRWDQLRCALMHEPRGHADMYGAILTAPVAADAHAGVLFMHHGGYSTMCGHGIIAVVTIALERGLLSVPDHSTQIILDTPAGTIRATATWGGDRVEHVSFVNVPSFVLHAGVPIRLGHRELRVDVAYGGAFYAVADGEAAGVPLRPMHLPELRRLGTQIREATRSVVSVVHPLEPLLSDIYGTIITGLPDRQEVDLRNVVIFADAQVDRSPSGTGTAALMAVVDAMGLLSPERPFVSESIIGTSFTGSVVRRIMVGDFPAIVPRIEGTAWIIGEHEFLIDDEDPFRAGFSLS